MQASEQVLTLLKVNAAVWRWGLGVKAPMTNDQLERERGIQPWGLTADKGPGLGHLVALFACGWVNAL